MADGGRVRGFDSATYHPAPQLPISQQRLIGCQKNPPRWQARSLFATAQTNDPGIGAMDVKTEQRTQALGRATPITNSLIRFYLWVGGLSLVLMAVLTPPFQVPDEPQHFYRSYQLSRLELRPDIQEGKAGALLPSSLSNFVQTQLGTSAHHTNQRRQLPQRLLSETLQSLSMPLAPQAQEFVEFSGSALYAPLAYAPQAIAIAVGRSLEWSPLALLWAARIVNSLAAFALIAWSIRRLGAACATGLVLALLPMTLFMLASASPDALTIAGGFVISAMVARFVVDGSWNRWDLALWVLGGMLLCAVKIVYLPLMFAGLAGLLIKGDPGVQRRWQGFGSQAVGALLVCVAIAFWLWWRPAGIIGTGGPPGADVAEQLALLRESPLLLLKIVPRTLYVEATFLAESFIGRLGWLNVPLPWWLHASAFAALACGLLLQTERSAVSPRLLGSLWVLTLAYVVIKLIVLAHYVAWTPVGNYAANGVQGRYLLPMAPLVAVALTWLARTPPAFGTNPALRTMLLTLCAVMPLAATIALIQAYALL